MKEDVIRICLADVGTCRVTPWGLEVWTVKLPGASATCRVNMLPGSKGVITVWPKRKPPRPRGTL